MRGPRSLLATPVGYWDENASMRCLGCADVDAGDWTPDEQVTMGEALDHWQQFQRWPACKLCGDPFLPSLPCYVCEERLARPSSAFCAPCEGEVRADLAVAAEAEHGAQEGDAGSRCDAACGHCGRCGGA